MTRDNPESRVDDDEIAEGATVMVERDEEPEEGTLLVQREPASEPEATISVDRGAEEGTVVVDRDRAAASREVDIDEVLEGGTVVSDAVREDGTLVVDRGHDGTVVSQPRDRPAASPVRKRSNKRRIALPPVEAGYAPASVDAVGPGAVEAYEPRAVSAPPQGGGELVMGADATRTPDPALRSVRRRSRRTGVVALLGFVAACVISVGGLVALAIALLTA